MTLLGNYQGELESVIESHTLDDGSVPACDPAARNIVADARRVWKRAEQLVKLLETG